MNQKAVDLQSMLVYDCRAAHRGRRLNAAFLALRDEVARAEFRQNRIAFYDRFHLNSEERSLIDAGDWDGLMRAGLSVYALGKARSVIEKDLLDIGAEIRGIDKVEFVKFLRRSHEGK
ncbi:MAG TPA: hypothetical protein VJ846_07390 [Sphingomicrobium sp.]|nr:hypothetical protein [Sphingomicrobium sp.]